MKFTPCTGQCTEDGSHCLGCGRSHEEIAATRKMVKDQVEFAQQQQYENPEEFIKFIAQKVYFTLQNS